MEEEVQEEPPPVRVRLVFENRHLLSKKQRSEGLRRCWVLLRPEIATVGDLAGHVTRRFSLRCSSQDEVVLSMDGFVLPPFESTNIFRDKDMIRVNGKMCKKKKKSKRAAICNETTTGQLDNNNNNNQIDMQIVPLNNIADRGKKQVGEGTSSKKKRKDPEKPEGSNSKKKKSKLINPEKPVVISEGDKNTACSDERPAALIVSQHNTVQKESSNTTLTLERNNEIVEHYQANTPDPLISGAIKMPSSRTVFHKEKGIMMTHEQLPLQNMHGSMQMNATYGASSSRQNAGPTRPKFQGPSHLRSNGPRWNGRNNNNYNNNNNIQRGWTESSGYNATSSRGNIGNNGSNETNLEKEKSTLEQNSDEHGLDFESLYPLTRLPKEGDVIAYRLVETYSRFPDLSPFRVGQVLIFDPASSMIIVLAPVPEYPLFPDGESDEPNKSLYNEDGSLEIDFSSLVDLRLVKESDLEIETGNYAHGAPAAHANNPKWAKGKDKAKVNSRKNGARNSNNRGNGVRNNNNWENGARNNNNWQNDARNSNNRQKYNNWENGAGNINNQEKNNNWENCVGNSNAEGDAGNNQNSGWDAAAEASNKNDDENGWGTWAATSRPSSSRGRQSAAPFFRGGKNGSRGGKYSNPKF